MKIGIITYHRALNYGAVLQAVALRVVLERMGNMVSFYDYWPSYHRSKYAIFSWYLFSRYSFKDKIYYCRQSLRQAGPRFERLRSFNKFLDTYVLPYCISCRNKSMDVAVYGSDQIWRKQYETGEYNPVYFGADKIDAPRKISYAASIGLLPDSEDDKMLIHDMLKNLDRISVRENDLYGFLKDLGVENHELVLDPTLLLTMKQWEKLVRIPSSLLRKYVLVYGITALSFDLERIRQFAADRGLDLIQLSGTASHNDNEHFYSTVGPEYFLSLIKNAEFVFSSSFHGVAFSIIFHRQFYAAFSSNSNRAKTLLDSLDLSDRLVEDDHYIDEWIDYESVDAKLEVFKKKSLDYLTRSVMTL